MKNIIRIIGLLVVIGPFPVALKWVFEKDAGPVVDGLLLLAGLAAAWRLYRRNPDAFYPDLNGVYGWFVSVLAATVFMTLVLRITLVLAIAPKVTIVSALLLVGVAVVDGYMTTVIYPSPRRRRA
jgi:MYXO-CTERM domain-containing protein